MKKGIEAIDAQIDSVTAYRQRERFRSIQDERLERQDADREAIDAYHDRQAYGTPKRATIVDRWAEECGTCGGPRMVHIDQDNQRVVESHSSGSEGSDVPCYGGW